ncbi:hypothetical protein [Niallia sp. FSL W8-1348]|uniref:hypothetical protein n=1 Tax=Niallia sp. FSL W8-1348 TaxID=2954656 RepID=UPI0030F6A9BE
MPAFDYLIEWASNINWKRYVLNKVVEQSQEDIEFLKKEIIDIKENNKNVELKVQKSNPNHNDLNLLIKGLQNPRNINALSENSKFNLGSNLNVFYGENGTGKSSYVKVFRKLAKNYFTNEKTLVLHPNVYKKGNLDLVQSIDITYEINRNEKSEIVDINMSNSALKNINVFDSDSIIPLLNENLSFSILPQGFNFFQETIILLDKLKHSFEDEITEYKNKKGKIFNDSSLQVINDEIKDIQENSTLESFTEYISKKYPQNKNYEIEITELNSQIKELTSLNIEDAKRLLKAQISKLDSINKTISLASTKLNEENLHKVNILIDQFLSKIAEEKVHNEKFNKQIRFLEKLNNEWLYFVKSRKWKTIL